jgi:NADP-dependent alcohol dehydrogenase
VQNFTFQNPVKILFGKGQIANIATEIPSSARVLITYGSGSIKHNGVYDQVKKALENHTVFEFGGIEPNPSLETLTKALALVQTYKIDFLLAVGGGSVLDGTKFIAAAVGFDGDPWDILAKEASISSALPLGAVMTLPATGSEMNSFFVITKASTQEKRVSRNTLVFPQFAVLDPSTTFSLPQRQIGNGIVDAFTHTVEQYLTYPVNSPLQDRMAEAILKTLIEEGPKTLANPTDYDARANVMWCASMALNGLIGVGVPQDWSTHAVGHELTALYGLDHAQSLAVVLPSMLSIRQIEKKQKLLQYAERVWNITQGSDDIRIRNAIKQTRSFFESVNVFTRLTDYLVSDVAISTVVKHMESHGEVVLGEHRDIGIETIKKVLALSL